MVNASLCLGWVRAFTGAVVNTARGYRLRCAGCGLVSDDDGLMLECPTCLASALLRTEYVTDGAAFGSGLFASWLPTVRDVDTAGFAVAYRAGGLGARIGLDELWVTFTGHWPERDANAPTGTFKDFEAAAVLGRLPADPPTIVIASTGNTAAAFLHAWSRTAARCVVIVPESGQSKLDCGDGKPPNATYVVLRGGASYADATALASSLAVRAGFQAEGGVRNVARRDGLARCTHLLLSTLDRVPDVYCQGVGSAAGALGSYESLVRVKRRTGSPLPRMLLAQNAPRAAVVDRWRGAAPAPLGPIVAGELANDAPPYDVAGGIRDMLADTGGGAISVSNTDTVAAIRLFEEVEGIDIEPAAGVALAALAAARRNGLVSESDLVHLNITGGGRRSSARSLGWVHPDLTLDARDMRDPTALRAAADRVARHSDRARQS